MQVKEVMDGVEEIRHVLRLVYPAAYEGVPDEHEQVRSTASLNACACR